MSSSPAPLSRETVLSSLNVLGSFSGESSIRVAALWPSTGSATKHLSSQQSTGSLAGGREARAPALFSSAALAAALVPCESPLFCPTNTNWSSPGPGPTTREATLPPPASRSGRQSWAARTAPRAAGTREGPESPPLTRSGGQGQAQSRREASDEQAALQELTEEAFGPLGQGWWKRASDTERGKEGRDVHVTAQYQHCKPQALRGKRGRDVSATEAGRGDGEAGDTGAGNVHSGRAGD